MKVETARQLRALSRAFYDSRAEDFDESRAELPWPGWKRLREVLPAGRLRILDIGCGNGRLARSLDSFGVDFDYVGLDASAGLLEAARARTPAPLAGRCEWKLRDVLEDENPDRSLPAGPFDLVVLMGVLHHVPGLELRQRLLEAARDRVAPGGTLAFTAWQFAHLERFKRRLVAWSEIAPVLGEEIDPRELETGDYALRFGGDPDGTPRYCHQMSDLEFEAWPKRLGLEPIADFEADGATGNLNRYWLLRAP